MQYTDSGNARPHPAGPAIIHYGLHCHVGTYHFTKYDYGDFDVNGCGAHFFKVPQRPQQHQALCAETVNMLNDALCDFYRTRCPAEVASSLRCPTHVHEGE